MTVELAPHVASTSLFPFHVGACHTSACDVSSKTPSLSGNAYRARCLEFIAPRRSFVSRYTAIPVDLFLLIFVPCPALVCFCLKNFQTSVLFQPGIAVLLYVHGDSVESSNTLSSFSSFLTSVPCCYLVVLHRHTNLCSCDSLLFSPLQNDCQIIL